MDCAVSRTGKCVEKPPCEDNDYYFSPFSSKCEYRLNCPSMHHWNPRSKKCDFNNDCYANILRPYQLYEIVLKIVIIGNQTLRIIEK